MLSLVSSALWRAFAGAALIAGVAWPGPSRAQPPASLLAPETGDAALWRAAGRRLQIELNELPEASRGAALASDLAAWRITPASPRAEAAIALELARRWFAAIQASLPGARWPVGRHPPEAYAQLAPAELLAAWRELEQAAAGGQSPQPALLRAWRVRDWTLGLVDRPTPFDALEDEAITALAGAAAPRPEAGPPSGTGGLTRETAAAWLLFGPVGGDHVGARDARPDGTTDVSLTLVTRHRGRTPIRIDLVPIDADNRPCCGRRWSSGDPGADFLGVIADNIGNGAGYASTLHGVGDTIQLFANDDPAFRVGGRLAALIYYADGSRDHGLAAIPASARP